MKTFLYSCLLLLGPVTPLLAQETESIILHRDSLFWNAYNRCDLTGMDSLFTDNVEFYHDKGGATFGLDSLRASIKNGLCKDPASFALRREAILGSVHVYPLGKNGVVYGAIMEGEHVFYIKQAGKDEYIDGQARFTHLWLKSPDGAWKMARVLSYDHHAAEYINKRAEIAVSDSVLRSHAGTYNGPQNGGIVIGVEKGHLLLFNRDKRFALYAETPDRFFMVERDLTFTFSEGKLVVREHGAVAEELVRQ